MLPITNAEKARWQGYSMQTLAELVKLGGKNDLPPLNWSINSMGIVGRISTTSDDNPVQTFKLWCGVAKAEEEPPRIAFDGRHIVRRAVAEKIGPHNRTDVVLELDFWKDEEN